MGDKLQHFRWVVVMTAVNITESYPFHIGRYGVIPRSRWNINSNGCCPCLFWWRSSGSRCVYRWIHFWITPDLLHNLFHWRWCIRWYYSRWIYFRKITLLIPFFPRPHRESRTSSLYFIIICRYSRNHFVHVLPNPAQLFHVNTQYHRRLSAGNIYRVLHRWLFLWFQELWLDVRNCVYWKYFDCDDHISAMSIAWSYNSECYVRNILHRSRTVLHLR